jgi:hypothetical protein
MSAHNNPLSNSHLGILSWEKTESSKSGELRVEVLTVYKASATLCSPVSLRRKMPLRVMCQEYSGRAIVRTCRRSSRGFIARVHLLEGNANARCAVPGFDPGVLAVEGFITEEQEEALLASLNDTSSVSQSGSSSH